jgi:hypothetical protein
MFEPRETDYLFFNVEYQDRATSSRYYVIGNELPVHLASGHFEKSTPGTLPGEALHRASTLVVQQRKRNRFAHE